jgi:hypothetical protein
MAAQLLEELWWSENTVESPTTHTSQDNPENDGYTVIGQEDKLINTPLELNAYTDLLWKLETHMAPGGKPLLDSLVKIVEKSGYITHREANSEITRAIRMLDLAIDKGKGPEEVRNRLRLLCSLLAWVITKTNPDKDITKIEKNIRMKILGESVPDVQWESNVEWRITTIASALSDNGFTLIADILKEKIKQWEPFTYNVFYDNNRQLNKFSKFLKSEGINDAQKYIKFIDTNSFKGIDSHWVWTRDGSIWMKDKNGKAVIMEPKASFAERPAQWGWNSGNDYHAFVTGIDIIQSNLLFQWWNIRQTNNTVFVGIEDILANIDALQIGEDLAQKLNRSAHRMNPENIKSTDIDKIVDNFSKTFWKKVFIVGAEKNWDTWNMPATKQAFFHIDLFFTPIGKNEIVMADVPSSSSAYDWTMFVKNSLEKQWFIVHKTPILTDYDRKDNKSDRSTSVDLTYNNVLIERFVDKKTWVEIKKVYVPQYASTVDPNKRNHPELKVVEKLDQQALESWRKAWFEAIPIRVDFSNIDNQWSLNCRTNESRS